MDFKEAVTKANELYDGAVLLNQAAKADAKKFEDLVAKAQTRSTELDARESLINQREVAVAAIEDVAALRDETNRKINEHAREDARLIEKLGAFNVLQTNELRKIKEEWASIQSAREALDASRAALEVEKTSYKDKILEGIRAKIG
jgi:chromosome segregation ATPase